MRKIIYTHKKKREQNNKKKRTNEAALVWTETLFLLPLAFFTEKTFCCCPTDAEKVKEDAILVFCSD